MPGDLSLVVIAHNERERIRDCLSSVPFASEKLVVDSGSTDGTREAAEEAGARVLTRPFTTYSDQKRWAAEQAGGDWILSLDADESLDPRLASTVLCIVSGTPEHHAYRLRFRVVFHGRPMRFGPWAGESHLRLYRKGSADYGEAGVHEGLSASGSVGVARPGFVIHRSWGTDRDIALKMERYARLWAEEKAAAGRRPSRMHALLRPAWRLVSGFILKGGFLEGSRGWQASVHCARYVRLKWMLLEEMELQGPAVTNEPGSTPSCSQTGDGEPGT